MSVEAPWAAWRAAVGLDLLVEAGGAASTWRCAACSEPVTAGGWLTWHVTFEAPGALPQGSVLVHLPDAEPVAVFVVPEAATAGGTRLTATFVVPDPGGD